MLGKLKITYETVTMWFGRYMADLSPPEDQNMAGDQNHRFWGT